MAAGRPPTMPTRTIVIPDTDGELSCWLDRLEEILLALTPLSDGAEDWDAPASPIGDGAALDALQKLSRACHRAERAAPVTLIAPDGRFELIPLHTVPTDTDDVETILAALRMLGAVTSGAAYDHTIADVLADHAARARRTPADLVAGCTRGLTLLDPVGVDDATVLAALLQDQHAERIVLSPDQHDAYRRLTGEHLAVFHTGDPLARFLYRG